MKPLNRFIKAVALGSSLSLATGFVLYRSGMFDNLLADVHLYSSTSAIKGDVYPQLSHLVSIDTFDTSQWPWPLLDSAQGSFLAELLLSKADSGREELYDQESLLQMLDSTMKKQRFLMYSSKSGRMIEQAHAQVTMIDTIRAILLAHPPHDTATMQAQADSPITLESLPAHFGSSKSISGAVIYSRDPHSDSPDIPVLDPDLFNEKRHDSTTRHETLSSGPKDSLSLKAPLPENSEKRIDTANRLKKHQ